MASHSKNSNRNPRNQPTEQPQQQQPPPPPTIVAPPKDLVVSSPDLGQARLREISEYVTIMFQGWDHLRSSSPEYPKHDALKDWYMKQQVRTTGRRISERLASAMATIVRPPQLTTGGSRRRKGGRV